MQINRVNSQPNFKGKTFLMIKPDAVKKGVEIEILEKILNIKGLKITQIKKDTLTREFAEAHYAVHKDKPFFETLIDYVTEGPVVKVEVKGKDAVNKIRKLSTEIRAAYGTDKTRNAVHTSDSKQSAKMELKLHLPPEPFSFQKLLNDLNILKNETKGRIFNVKAS